MAILSDLDRRIRHMIKVAGKTGVNGVDWKQEDDVSDGLGPKISDWNVAGMVEPTQVELEALTSDPAYIAFDGEETAKNNRPSQALIDLKTIPGVKTILTESMADTVARFPDLKFKVLAACVKYLVIKAVNEEIESMSD